MTIYDQLYAAFEVAFENTIRSQGIDALKRTSLFGSNDRAEVMPLAA